MAADYVILTEPSLLLIRWKGVISDADFLDVAKQVLNDDKWELGIDILADLTNANISGLSLDALVSGSELMKSSKGPAEANFKFAGVVSDPVTYGIGRMYEALAALPHELVQIFYDMNEALVWLQLDPDVLHHLEDSASDPALSAEAARAGSRYRTK